MELSLLQRVGCILYAYEEIKHTHHTKIEAESMTQIYSERVSARKEAVDRVNLNDWVQGGKGAQ